MVVIGSGIFFFLIVVILVVTGDKLGFVCG